MQSQSNLIYKNQKMDGVDCKAALRKEMHLSPLHRQPTSVITKRYIIKASNGICSITLILKIHKGKSCSDDMVEIQMQRQQSIPLLLYLLSLAAIKSRFPSTSQTKIAQNLYIWEGLM